ncbi:GNAT family N-acetyltransferase [Alphaproteobacteria bacterium]|nr:GNAT family N-acetyltransferase [Alphaproteobacteria bacterium]
MKFKSLSLLTTLFLGSLSFSALEDGITVTDKASPVSSHCFHRKNSPIYLACTTRINMPDEPEFTLERGSIKRSFHIYLFEDMGPLKKGADLGHICVGIRSRCLYIADMEIKDPSHRGKGFGTSALQTLLGIYNSEKRASMSFDHFCLATTERNTIALRVYRKCGFKVGDRGNTESHGVTPGWLFLTLDRKAKD